MVSREEVKHLAWLARIDLKEEELEVYARQVESIIAYLGALDKVQQEAEPLRRQVDYTKFRDDTIQQCRDDVLSVVKNTKERFVKAPKMV